MNFGFSYVGFIYLVMLMLPNLLWTKNRPENYEDYVGNENRILLMLERIGEVLVSCSVLVFSDFNIRPWSARSWWLALSFAFMVLYELFWIRYFRGEKTMKDFYSNLCGIPVAGASLPVAAFFALSVYGRNAVLAVSVLILGVGHIGIHRMHQRETEGKENEK